MSENKKTGKSYWCGRCRMYYSAASMCKTKFCCCISCNEKSRDAKLAHQSESQAQPPRVKAHTLEHKQNMDKLAYRRELAAIQNINEHLNYE